MAREIWQANYLSGRYNRWPYDAVVGAVMRLYARHEDRSAIRILDLGCGGGNNTVFLAEAGFDFCAVDAAPEGVRLTKERVGLPDADPRVLVADFIDLPFPADHFDAVIERASLCCNIGDDLRAAISEISRVLRSDGRFIGVDMYGVHTTDLKYGRALGDGDYVDFTSGMFVHSQEVHAFTQDQIEKLFCGFEIESLTNVTATVVSEPGTVRESYNLIARKL